MDGARKIAPYGSWKSPITSDLIVARSITLSEVRLDGSNIYWLEGRPQEQGRYVVVRGNEGRGCVILTRRFALELGQHGITVNAVAPGFVRTDLTRRGRAAADWPGREERSLSVSVQQPHRAR